jgi:hypothetical protein
MTARRKAFDETILEKVRALENACKAKVCECSSAIKAEVSKADGRRPSESVRHLLGELGILQHDLSSAIEELQISAGISEAQIEAFEHAHNAASAQRGSEYWHGQILKMRPTSDLDAHAESGLEKFLSMVDQNWLREQSRTEYRLGANFLCTPLHLVNNVRIGMMKEPEGPQRLARMLLICQDHLQKEWNLDFFSAATFVPELAMLGNNLTEIKELGPEAARKLANLSTLPDDMVTAAVYELLVGAACIRRGLDVEMVPEDRSHKVPDYRVLNVGVPAAIECKRRLGLTKYELEEAGRVEGLYGAIRRPLQQDGSHYSIEACFREPVRSVSAADFLQDVAAAAKQNLEGQLFLTQWGSLAIRRLSPRGDFPGTRLYSPDFLERVFNWNSAQSQWDGLLCEVKAPHRIAIERFSQPLCLKWRSESEEALTKKARGVTSLWADAVRQIPDGEIGFIYIAYPEGAREAIADARTRHILEYMAKECWHRWSVKIAVTMITRLYARAVGGGCPP